MPSKNYAQSKIFLTIQATDVTVSVKNPNRSPVNRENNSPAVRSMSRRISENSTVPSTPAINVLSDAHRQKFSLFLQIKGAVKRVTARSTSATPKKIQYTKAGTAKIAEKLRNAATMPTMTLAMTAKIVQSHFVLQPQIFIKSPPVIILCTACLSGE